MKKTIYKYHLANMPSQVKNMPAGAQILHVGMQEGEVCLWAIVDPSQPDEERKIFMTAGAPILESYKQYLGTIMYGNYVMHVFEI